MNSDMLQGSWAELKGKIKAKWGKFSDDEIETLKGNLDQIAGKIQKYYGFAKEKAEAELKDFKAAIHSKTAQVDDDANKEGKQS